LKIGEGKEKEPILYDELDILTMIEDDQKIKDIAEKRTSFIVKLVSIHDEWRKK